MAKTGKVSADNLGDAIRDILDEYAEDVQGNLDQITKRVAQKGVQALRSASGVFKGSGKYKSGWSVDITTNRLGTTAHIWNKKTPGLPHLLEYGHANVGGGRTPGREHIAPVEEALVREFTQAIEEKLK